MAAIVALSVAGIGDFIRRFGEGLSTKGIFIPSNGAPPVGTPFELRVDAPDGRTIFSAGAHVEWTRLPGSPDGPSGVYLAFDVLNKDARAFLEMIEQRNAPPPPPVGAAPEADAPEMSLDEISAPPAPDPSPEPQPSPQAGYAPPPDAIPGIAEFLDAVGEAQAAPASPAPPSLAAEHAWEDPAAEEPHDDTLETPAASIPVATDPREEPGIVRIDTVTSAALLEPEPEPEPAAAEPVLATRSPWGGDVEEGSTAPVASPFASADEEPTSQVAPAPPADPAVPSTPTPIISSPPERSPPPPPPLREPTPLRGAPKPPSKLILGIDLGTTFSCAAVVRDGKNAEVIPSESGHRTIPSVVTVTDTVEVVGWAANDKLATFPKQTIYGHKRLLGRDFNSQAVQDALKYFDYEIVPDENGFAGVRIGGRVYSLTWVSGRILEEVRNWASAWSGENVVKAIITVPAYYSDRQRQAVVDAGREAGLDVLRIVNEPTAAAVAYGANKNFDQKIMVYDFGGGTFDVSILEVSGNVIDVLATGGDPYLGGVDLDNRIVDFLLAEFQKQEDVDLARDKVVKLRLRQAAETAKRDLSQKAETRIHVPYVCIRQDKPCHLDIVLTRDKLNRLVADLVDRSIDICKQVLADAKLTVADLNEVLFVGGQTRMPLIQGKVHAFTGKQPRKGVHPDEAVAIGAAILGHGFDKVDAITLIDVVSLPIGVGLPGGRFKPVVNAQTKLPVAREFTIATTRDGQTSLVVDIFQGEFDRVDFNDFLGSVKIPNLPARPKGEISAKIEFRLDAQGFLTITSTDSVTKQPQRVKLVTRDTPETLKEAHLEAERERKAAEAEAAKKGEPAPAPKKPGLIRRLFGAK